ncbi:MAG: hypothetical protein HY898_29505 [Deltaproteobacteria bacterium]|nr:hypothetical protein [Deltaproteobacteria bacterium]
MQTGRALLALILGVQAVGCAASPAVPAPAATPPAAPSSPPRVATAESCQAPYCRLFDTPEAAFSEVLKSAPRILAVGEFHALKSHKGLKSPVARFTDTLVPMLAETASDIVIEYWVGTGQCPQQEKEVVREQRPVTQSHAESTPNEFLRLGDQAKARGIRPHPLTVTCEDYQRILKAGDESVREMLVLTARMFSSNAKLYFQRNQAIGAEKTIVTYSGAMHNDLRPDHACGEPCSFGKELETLAAGRYVELDLVVPEYIHDGPVWRERVWYPHFDRQAFHPKTTLFNPYPGSYVLIFPSTAGWKPEAQSPSR